MRARKAVGFRLYGQRVTRWSVTTSGVVNSTAEDGWGPHMIPFPDDPRTDWIDGYDYRVNDYDGLIASSTGLPAASADRAESTEE